MNLQQIILIISLLSPSFLCMGMEQSNVYSVSSDESLGYSEYELLVRLYSDLNNPNQSPLLIKPSKVLPRISQDSEVLPRINQPSRVLTIMAQRKELTQSQPTQNNQEIQNIEISKSQDSIFAPKQQKKSHQKDPRFEKQQVAVTQPTQNAAKAPTFTKRPDKPLFTPSRQTNTTYSQPTKTSEPRQNHRTKKYLPPKNQEIIYISSNNEIIEID